METTVDKQHAHQMLDQLGPGQFEAVVRLLEVLTEPAAALRAMPFDEDLRATRKRETWPLPKSGSNTTGAFRSKK